MNCRYADLGVSNMRAAIKGIEVARHLSASRASFEWSKGLLEEGADTEVRKTPSWPISWANFSPL